MKKLLRLLLLAWFLSQGARFARATPGWKDTVNTDPASGVSIELSSPFERVPLHGYLPCIATIKNRSGAPRQWKFSLESSLGYSSKRRQLTAEQTVRVENDREVRVPLLLPVVPYERATQNYRSSLVRTTGYGIDYEQRNALPNNNPGSAPSMETVFVGMSEKLAHDAWPALTDHFKAGKELAGSPLDLTLLPPDWRALAGLECLWLTAEDYAGLDAGQQDAIQQWVASGGSLFVCETSPDPITHAKFGLDVSSARETVFGFGDVEWVAYDGKKLSVDDTAAKIEGLHQSTSPDPSQGLAQSWRLAQTTGTLRLNHLFLTIFIGLFAVLIGPVNLFYFARQGWRHRLFWTTPLISLVASLLLIAVIVLQDGFGGNGSRASLIYLLPAQSEAVVIQEQVSRTGVLFSHDFTAREDLFLTPVEMMSGSGQEYDQNGRYYDGSWYATRSVQAQRAEAVVPTRARLDLLNTEQARTGAPPVVTSSLPVELTELRYTDPAGRRWRGKGLRTGERQILQPDHGPSSVEDNPGGSSYLDDLLRTNRERNGSFCAVADRGQFLETLPSIRWTHERAVILGPVTPTR